MKTKRYTCMIVGLSILGGIANAEAPKSASHPPSVTSVTTDAWRSSLTAFGKEVVAVAERSTMTDAAVGITRLREHTVFTVATGAKSWVLFKQGFDQEFQGELEKHFTGEVAWSGVVASAKTDTKNSLQKIEIKLPVPSNLPQGMEFIETITVSIPVSKLPVAKMPAKGTEFAFRATLKKVKDDDLFQPVWVIYGLGPNLGKIRVGVVLVDAEPLEKK